MDMITIQNSLPRLLDTVLDPQGQPVQGTKSKSIFGDGSLQKAVDKPEGRPPHETRPLSMAPRPETLDGKTIYLVDGQFGGGYEFLEEMQGWFRRNMPAVKTVIKRKPGNMFMDAPDLWAEIKENGDAMILGVGG
jgi:hypothetical protein